MPEKYRARIGASKEEKDIDEIRRTFETKVRFRYFTSFLGRTPRKPDDEIDVLAEVLHKDGNGCYTDTTIGAMWFGYCLSEGIPYAGRHS